MIKKIMKVLVLLIGVIAIIPLHETFAAEGGLLNKRPMIKASSITATSTSTTDTLTNGDYSWSDQMAANGFVYAKFDTPMNLTKFGVRADSNTTGQALTVQYFDADKKLIAEVPVYSGGYGSTLAMYDYAVENVSYIGIINKSTKWIFFSEFDVWGTDQRSASNLTATKTNKSINIQWKNPSVTGNSGTEVYLNNSKVATVGKGVTSYTFEKLDADTTYTVGVASTFEDQNVSMRSNLTVTTDQEDLVLSNVKGEATAFNETTLTWKKPNNKLFKSVNIYRTGPDGKETLIGNSTDSSYIDKTVFPKTSYSYRLSLVNTSNVEVDNKEIEIKTPAEKAPEMNGLSSAEQTNGDFTVKWEEPTKGTVKILVAGKEYKIVNAADKQITIPSADMKYTMLKDADVQVIPITEYGTLGVSTNVPSEFAEKAKLPFGVNDLLESGVSLLWLVAPFVLLALSFLLVPKLRRLIVQAFRGKGSKEKTGRRTKDLDKKEKEQKELKDKPEKEQKEVVSKPTREKIPRGIRVSERELKEPKVRREKAPKEPRTSRASREPREGRQRAIRAERQPRTSRETRR